MRNRSCTRYSANENGHEQIEAEYYKTFWQWLFCRSATTKVWVRVSDTTDDADDGEWYDKFSMDECDEDDLVDIYDIKHLISKEEKL